MKPWNFDLEVVEDAAETMRTRRQHTQWVGAPTGRQKRKHRLWCSCVIVEPGSGAWSAKQTDGEEVVRYVGTVVLRYEKWPYCSIQEFE